MSDLKALEDWAGALLQKLTPQQRAAVARKVGQTLRASQSQRIAAQKAPDGSAYQPRAKSLRQKPGIIRRKAMFSKLRTAKYLKVSASAQEIGVGFIGRVARIAHVHQKGARVTPEGGRRPYSMPRRELLGLTDSELDTVRGSLIDLLIGK